MMNVYLFDISYFSGKFEGYLRYKQIPHRRIELSWTSFGTKILRNTGLMKVPVVELPDGTWLQDSTPMIDYFEARHPEGSIIPGDPYQAFFSRLLEDYADEYLWRPALHYRWSYPVDAHHLGDRFSREFMADGPLPRGMTARLARSRQLREYVRGDGVTARTRPHVESVYLETLARLEAIFQVQPYLLGGRPSLADFGFFASMFRHFSLDPTPAKIMRNHAPGVYEWVARLWNARHSRAQGDWAPPGTVPVGWGPILDDIGSAYLPYLHDNAVAYGEGKRRFDAKIQGVPYENLPVVQYRVWCRERLQQHFSAVPDPAKPAVQATLEQHGCWEPLHRGGVMESHLHDGGEPPLCRPKPLSARDAWKFKTFGRAW
jgi:glutathione S-transferase